MAKRIFDYARPLLTTTDGGSATFDIPVPEGSTLGFDAIIIPRVVSSNVGGLIPVQGAIHNDGGTVALTATPITPTPVLNTAIALATAVFTANSTNLRLTVTGVAAIGDIQWLCEIRYIVN